MRCKRERSFTAETMEPLGSNISVSADVGKRETMQRIAVSVYPKFVESVNSHISGFWMMSFDHDESFADCRKGWKVGELLTPRAPYVTALEIGQALHSDMGVYKNVVCFG